MPQSVGVDRFPARCQPGDGEEPGPDHATHQPPTRSQSGAGSGEVSFDRVEALSRIPEHVGWLQHLDVSAVRREAALRARISSETEARGAADQYLVLQPSLDESWWRL
jgi:hypothetical protein